MSNENNANQNAKDQITENNWDFPIETEYSNLVEEGCCKKLNYHRIECIYYCQGCPIIEKDECYYAVFPNCYKDLPILIIFIMILKRLDLKMW